MSLQSVLAAFGGDLHRSWRSIAFWPWPAVVFNHNRQKVSWDDYRAFTMMLQPGDLLLMRSEPYFISNFFIQRNGTAFSHLAVYTGAVKGYRDTKTNFILKAQGLGLDHEHTGQPNPGVFERTVTHAISEGIVCQDLGEVFFHADWIAAVRPWKTKIEQKWIVESALGQLGLEYNFEFKPVPTYASFYCTQLGEFCCKKAGIEPPEPSYVVNSIFGLLTPFKRFKAPAPLADSFVKFPMVCCSVSCNEPAFARSSQFAEKLRNAFHEAPDASARV
jgi:hypothetical protein